MDKSIHDLLHEYAADELNDEEKYHKLADMLREHGYYKCAGILCDIAHEEHTHHELIEHIMRRVEL